jgi:hypothetical protein
MLPLPALFGQTTLCACKTETAARPNFVEIYRATVDRPMRNCGLQAQRAKADADAVNARVVRLFANVRSLMMQARP